MEQIYEAVSYLMDAPVSQVTDGTMDELVLRLDALKRIQVIAKDLRDALELEVMDRMPDNDMAIQGVGLLHRRTKFTTTVKDGATPQLRRDLPIAVARKVGVDPYTGEISTDRREAAADAVRVMLDAVSITASSLKRSAHDAIGLDPDDYTQQTGRVYLELEPIPEDSE